MEKLFFNAMRYDTKSSRLYIDRTCKCNGSLGVHEHCRFPKMRRIRKRRKEKEEEDKEDKELELQEDQEEQMEEDEEVKEQEQ